MMAHKNFYLNKYGFTSPQIATSPHHELGIIVVIPCFNEPDLITTLNSLNECNKPKSAVEIIVVLNSGENHDHEILDRNRKTKFDFENWKSKGEKNFDFHLIHFENLPAKHAGVGLARKIGMDEAVNRFDFIEKDGIIVCFDADCTCSKNYLQSIETHFNENPKSPGCSIYFEHILSGDKKLDDAIIHYELHLRYYKNALAFCELPYAFHTVGSSMAVKSSAYQMQGGMNKRKAGEDFYFLHKIISLGNFTELNSAVVYPSNRTSDRVPFGTGRAMIDHLSGKKDVTLTYNFNSFRLIKFFIQNSAELRNNDLEKIVAPDESAAGWNCLLKFLQEENFKEALIEIRKNSSSDFSFKKRFYLWFNAFRTLKLVHYLRDCCYTDQPLVQEALNLVDFVNKDEFELLSVFRRIDKNLL